MTADPTVMDVNRARIVLVLLGVFGGLLIWSPGTPRAVPGPPPGEGDVVLYRAIAERLRAGEAYYPVLGDELRSRGYPTIPLFNWRTPLHLSTLAAVGVRHAGWLLHALALTALLLVPIALQRLPSLTMLGALFFLMGALATTFRPEAVLFAEVCAGVMIALSLLAYYRRAWIPAAMLGTLALFTRELAAPFCLVCGLHALWSRRRGESLTWILAAGLYGIYYWMHATSALSHVKPGDLQHVESWFGWNGLDFLLSTIRVNGWLRQLPAWAAPLYALVALSSLTSDSAPRQLQLSLSAYCIFFTVAGQDFNYYWGFVTAPIWAFAAAHGLEQLPALVRTAVMAQPSATVT